MNHEDTKKMHDLLDRLSREVELSSEVTPDSDRTNAAIFDAFRATYVALVRSTEEIVALEGPDFAARVAAFTDGSSAHSAEVRYQMKPPRMTVEFVAQFGHETRRMVAFEQAVLGFSADLEDATPSTSH